jgi:hypothetical protein
MLSEIYGQDSYALIAWRVKPIWIDLDSLFQFLQDEEEPESKA